VASPLSPSTVALVVEPLSPREREVLGLFAEGLTVDEIAERLFLSTHTVRTHGRNAVAKLGARSRAHAVAIAIREGHLDGRGQ
jgi:DNA-binding CsgD family transcriptional regulator